MMLIHVSSPPHLSSSVPSADNMSVRVPVARARIFFSPKDHKTIGMSLQFASAVSAAPLLCRVTIDICDRDAHERHKREFHAETNEDECVSRLARLPAVPRFRQYRVAELSKKIRADGFSSGAPGACLSSASRGME